MVDDGEVLNEAEAMVAKEVWNRISWEVQVQVDDS
jgi:hypothetical protein